MTSQQSFEHALTARERKLLAGLTTPFKIQAFLDSITYSTENRYRCPLNVIRERVGHCFDGALFAAMALRRLGHPPRVLDLLPNGRDDDHLLALYQVNGCWGAVAKSNFTVIRFREPVYRTVRELVMSYFDFYFNARGEKTLRGYAGPLSLRPFDRRHWLMDDAAIDLIADRLDAIRPVVLLTPEMEARLERVDKKLLEAGMLGVNPAGLFKL